MAGLTKPNATRKVHMKIVMTLMVRDEADVIRPMIEHHRAQGIDHFIVTDNGSVDGTFEILGELEMEGDIDLRQDLVQQKQQSKVVTAMARHAYSLYAADWVLNADADEFWVAQNPAFTVRGVLESTPKSFQSFQIPVIDMTGAPALAGSGLQRLVYRDARAVEELHAVGLLAHSSPNAVHVGVADLQVAQGNHTVSLESLGSPQPGAGLEVLHFPWRSWAQFARKVEASGRAYDSNVHLKPSPNHHGMRDYRLYLKGGLLASYLLRHPTADDLERGLADGSLVHEQRIADSASGSIPDEFFTADARLAADAYSVYVRGLQEEMNGLKVEIATLSGRIDTAAERVRAVEAELEGVCSRTAVKVADRVAEIAKHPSTLLARSRWR